MSSDRCPITATARHNANQGATVNRRVVWFSCGAASAVAAKIAVETYGDDCAVVYCDTMATEHPDNERFFVEVERWIGRSIQRIRSAKYQTINDVFEQRRYLSGVKGALCTVEMKKIPREKWQRDDDVHIFGYTSDEQSRADRFEDGNPAIHVEWILIDRSVTKDDCMRILNDSGIGLPAMYALGFDHNNCLGCVKSTSPGYWNRTRRLFPDVFALRCRQSRLLGVKLVRVRLPSDLPSMDAPRHFLDELPAESDAADDDIDCGPVCQIGQMEFTGL